MTDNVTDTRKGFTKGPWEVGYSAFEVLACNGRMKVCDIRGWGFLTGKGAGALGLSEAEGSAIQHANAHLIAAAPALYKALQLAGQVLADPVIGTPDQDDPAWYRQVDAALTAIDAALTRRTILDRWGYWDGDCPDSGLVGSGPLTGRSPSGRACAPSGLSQSPLSQAEPLVPNALTEGEFAAVLRAGIQGTQRDFARRLGVSDTYISLVMHGKKKPGRKLLAAFGLRRQTMLVSAQGMSAGTAKTAQPVEGEARQPGSRSECAQGPTQ